MPHQSPCRWGKTSPIESMVADCFPPAQPPGLLNIKGVVSFPRFCYPSLLHEHTSLPNVYNLRAGSDLPHQNTRLDFLCSIKNSMLLSLLSHSTFPLKLLRIDMQRLSIVGETKIHGTSDHETLRRV